MTFHHRNFFPNMMTNPWITGHMFSCISLWMHQANKWTSNRACALKELWNAFHVVFIKIQRQQLQERNPTSKCQNLIYVLSFWSKNCWLFFLVVTTSLSLLSDQKLAHNVVRNKQEVCAFSPAPRLPGDLALWIPGQLWRKIWRVQLLPLSLKGWMAHQR